MSSSDVAAKGKQRTGIHTTSIIAVSLTLGHQIALYFTGRQHAGENFADVLQHRNKDLPPPLHTSDGLDHNKPGKIQVISGKCLTHGRRQMVDVATSFPQPARYVIEAIGEVYSVDKLAKKRQLSDNERLLLHQEKSGPVMDALRRWLVSQLLEDTVEPNSGLGKAIQYLLRRWKELTLFLRQPGAPLDNNICERALKTAILHRKNSLFYKTKAGARVGDLFMSLIQTCHLNHVDEFKYIEALLSNLESVQKSPGSWLPWNYESTLRSLATATAGPEPQAVRPEPSAADNDKVVQTSRENSPVTDHDLQVDEQGQLTGTQGCVRVSLPPVDHGTDAPSAPLRAPINAASPVESKTTPGPDEAERREEAIAMPCRGPTRCGPTQRGRPDQARSPT